MNFHIDGTAPRTDEIFVFGSNLSGIHGGGAARAAFDLYGAKWGVAEGRTGSSYAIPTVAKNIAGPLTVEQIGAAVGRFLSYASANPRQRFFVTRIGCGLAGHKDADIAPMFAGASSNCSLPDTWAQFIKEIA